MTRQITILFLLTTLTVSCSDNSKSVQADNVSSDSLANKTADSLTNDTNAGADNDCVFDTSTYKFTTEALKKYKQDIKFVWDDKEKEAKTILENGDTLVLHIGGCYHFSYAARLYASTPFADTKVLTEKSRWLAKTFFDNGFDTKYDQCISTGQIKESESRDPQNIKMFEIIDSDTAITNKVYDGFLFERQQRGTKISIDGYIS